MNPYLIHCGQVLNLTQYIEDGFENKPELYLSIVQQRDTVNHRALVLKLAKSMKKITLIRLIELLLTNRRFFVEMNGKRSRWRKQKNGLLQGLF